MSISFISGSHAYGKPTSKSDIDLVIHRSKALIKTLRKLGSIKSGEPIKFGNLNLIVCESDAEFAVWKLATTNMKMSQRSFNKKQAKAILDSLRNMVGIQDKAVSG